MFTAGRHFAVATVCVYYLLHFPNVKTLSFLVRIAEETLPAIISTEMYSEVKTKLPVVEYEHEITVTPESNKKRGNHLNIKHYQFRFSMLLGVFSI